MSLIFISYRRKDIDRLQPLLDELEAEGVDYWLDKRDVEPFSDFSDAVVTALSNANALLAWYSRDYPESRACQWEFTAAFLTAQQETDPFQRVLVINPEASDDHLLLPQEIRGQNIRPAPLSDDATGFKQLAQQIATHLNKITSPLGQVRPGEMPPYYGRKITHSQRFVGRLKEFWKIHWALHNGSDRTITASAPVHLVQLIGLGGIGKSMFTEEYAARYGWAYPGGIFWVDAYGADDKTPESMEEFAPLRHQQLERIARELGIDLNVVDKGNLPYAIRRKLEERGKPYLWIVDDLPSGLDLKELDLWLAPDTVHGKTLITTRTTSYHNRGSAIDLDKLDDNAAYRLLTRELDLEEPAEIESAKGIVTDLGGHPLALELAAACLENYAGMMSFAEYRQILANPDDDALKMAEEFTDMLPNGHEKSIAATMRHSIKQLGEEGLDFLRLAAQLSPAPIPSSLVASSFAVADGLEDPKAKLRAAQAFNQTEKHSLAQVVEPKLGLRSVHTLVSRVIHFDGDYFSRCQALRAAAVQALNDVLHDVVDIRNHLTLEHPVSHARVLVKKMVDENDATLGAWVARHDHERGDYSSARNLIEKVLTLQTELFGERHLDTLAAMHNLAAILRAQGDLAGARALQEKELQICRSVHGEEHPATLSSMNNLAGTLWEQGNLPKARALHEKTLEGRRHVFGDEHPDTLTSMNNLALVLRKQDELSSARTLHENTLNVRSRVLGEEHPKTLASMNNLAEVIQSQGDLKGSRVLHEKAFKIFCRVLGEEHPDTLVSMSNLATTLWSEGDYISALALENKALEITRRILGVEHPKTSVAAFNLFCTLWQNDARKEALNIFQSDLNWLLNRAPATLGAAQLYIRGKLAEFVKSQTPRTSQPSRKKQGKRKK